jgi:hypothetical protein
LLMGVGLVVGLVLLQGPVFIGGLGFDAQTLLYAAAAIVLGFQAIAFGVFTKVFAISEGLLPEDPKLTFTKIKFNLEKGLILGACLIITGLVCSVYSVFTWKQSHFGTLDPARTLRIIIPAITALIIGVQIVFSSLFLSVLGLRRR